jgi:hypothetical protein
MDDEPGKGNSRGDVKCKEIAAGVARGDDGDDQEDKRDPTWQDGRCARMAVMRDEPNSQVGERHKDQNVAQVLVPVQPHAIPAQEPAGKRRLDQHTECEDSDKYQCDARSHDAF